MSALSFSGMFRGSLFRGSLDLPRPGWHTDAPGRIALAVSLQPAFLSRPECH
jgi:hypothetical protein